MRDAALGDVHLSHDLQAADERRLEVLGNGHGFDQNAVDSVSDSNLLGLRLRVDVAGSVVDRLLDDGVGQFDDRSLLRHLLRFALFIRIVGGRSPDGCFGHHAAHVGIHLRASLLRLAVGGLTVRLGPAVILDDGVFDRAGNGHHGDDTTSGDHAHIVHGLNVVGIGHRQPQVGPFFLHRDDVVVLRDPLRHDIDRAAFYLRSIEIGEANALLLRLGEQNLALACKTQLDDDLSQILVGLMLDLFGFFKLFGFDVFLFEKEFFHRHACQRHLTKSPVPQQCSAKHTLAA